MLSMGAIQELAIGATTGAAAGFALFGSRWFLQFAIGKVAALLIAGLVLDGVEGYLAWTGHAISSLPRFPMFLAGAASGFVLGGILGARSRRRQP